MDDIDHACEHEQLRRDLAMRYRKTTGPDPTGACHFCSTPLNDPQRWCDADCRDDWQHEQHARRQQCQEP